VYFEPAPPQSQLRGRLFAGTLGTFISLYKSEMDTRGPKVTVTAGTGSLPLTN
jgi:hypothetical protein